MIRRLVFPLFAGALLLAPLAPAQTSSDGGSADDGGASADAGDLAPVDPPDGSVGQGGADRDNPEADDSFDRVPTTCHRTVDCAPGFRCEQGRCRYAGIRDAQGGFFGQGCTAAGEAGMLLPELLAAALVWRRCGPRSR
ncbi:MAG: hypothetical protein IRZ16_06020 [Myxococcaceae bacterium]|nr:hypothetical protein [Myxococcaceae bacterium]